MRNRLGTAVEGKTVFRESPFRWAHKAVGTRLRLGLAVSCQCALTCVALWKYAVLCDQTETPAGHSGMALGFAAFIVVFMAVLPSWCMYVMYRLLRRIDARQ